MLVARVQPQQHRTPLRSISFSVLTNTGAITMNLACRWHDPKMMGGNDLRGPTAPVECRHFSNILTTAMNYRKDINVSPKMDAMTLGIPLLWVYSFEHNHQAKFWTIKYFEKWPNVALKKICSMFRVYLSLSDVIVLNPTHTHTHLCRSALVASVFE